MKNTDKVFEAEVELVAREVPPLMGASDDEDGLTPVTDVELIELPPEAVVRKGTSLDADTLVDEIIELGLTDRKLSVARVNTVVEPEQIFEGSLDTMDLVTPRDLEITYATVDDKDPRTDVSRGVYIYHVRFKGVVGPESKPESEFYDMRFLFQSNPPKGDLISSGISDDSGKVYEFSFELKKQAVEKTIIRFISPKHNRLFQDLLSVHILILKVLHSARGFTATADSVE